MRPIAVVGHLARDLVDGLPPRPGGGPYYAARALRVLRRPAVVAAKCGAADRAELYPPLVALGIPTHCLAGRSTASFGIRYEGESRTMTVEGIGDPWTPEEARGWLARTLEGVGWAHVAALLRTDFPPETLAEMASGRRLSLDGQGLVRPGRTGPLELDADFDPELLRHVSILKLSEEEARVLLDDLDERSLRSLGVPEIVVTLGSHGSIVYADGVAERVPARPVEQVDNPTGAGDAFSAAYLVARSGGHTPTAAARRAAEVVAAVLSPHRR